MRIKVSNSTTNESLPGLVFIKKGTSTGATSDENGFVELEAGETYTSHFTGYDDSTFVATNDNVFLNEKPGKLSEVVIIGEKSNKSILWILLLIVVIYYLSRQ